MKRHLYQDLKTWKNNPRRKPLLLQGAHQVGKTWLVESFANQEYGNFITFNFEQKPGLGELFSRSLSPDTLIENLSLHLGKKISSKDTWIFFDEIQTVPEVLTSLTRFIVPPQEISPMMVIL